MIKWAIHQENITLVSIYAPNIEAPEYVKQIWVDIKGEIDSNTVMVEDFNTVLISMDSLPDRNSTRQHQP